MGRFAYRPVGQSLRLGAASGAFYTDAAYQSAVAAGTVLPTSDTTYYAPDGPVRVVLEQLDGSTVYDATVAVLPVGSQSVEPPPTPGQVAADIGHLVWQDLRVSLTRAATGPTLPTLAAFRNGVWAYQFSNTTDQQLFLDVQLPHGIIGGATTPGGAGEIRPHVHWSAGANAGGDTGGVKWSLEYTWANAVNGPGNAFGASTTLTVVQAATGTPYDHQIAAWDPIDITGMRDSAILLCRLFRDADGTGDDFAATGGAFALSLDFHYQTTAALPGSIPEYPAAS